MPLRGQNNVQGACDTGCLPYFGPDYTTPKEIGLMTPQLIDEMIAGRVKAMYVMGEDIAHIHPNQNKVHKGLANLELIISNELFMNEVTKMADIIFGVKSAYEKTGVYVNAMRRLHLSQPLVECEMPDDWEVLRDIENKINGEFEYKNSEDVWNETKEAVGSRFSGATYHKLSKNRNRGMLWPVKKEDTPILHIDGFRTSDKKGIFHYHQYQLREQIKKLVNKEEFAKNEFYLTTGRTIVQYNNAAQTKRCEPLNSKYDGDIVLASLYIDDKEELPESEQKSIDMGNGQKKKIKTIGDKWSMFQQINFNNNSQPHYVLVTPDGKVINNPVSGYMDKEDFKAFLDCGIRYYKKK